MPIVADPMKLSLPEQVGENKKQIKKIWEFLDGLSVSDNVIKITSLSQLTAEELEIVKRDIAFIVYGSEIYYKTKTTSSEAIFEKLAKFELSEYVTLSSDKIIVTLSNGALGAESSSVNIYSNAQVDSALAAEKSYVDNNFAKLSGANFTGAITAPTITENMSGYAFTKRTVTADFDLDYAYAGVVKNGNKITFAICAKIVNHSIGAGAFNIGRFDIPSAVGSKLFPVSIGGINNALSTKNINLTSTAYSVNTKVATVFKISDTQIQVNLYGLDGLAPETEFLLRYEETFLLSDNLAS